MDMRFSELIEARRSVRKYAKAEISKDEMTKIVEEALNAPSWKNTETLFNRNRQLSQKFNFFKLTNILDCVITISILRIPFRTQETFIFIEADIFLSDTNQLFNLINFHLLTSRYIIS